MEKPRLKVSDLNSGTFDCSEFRTLLSEEWEQAILFENGLLNPAGVDLQLNNYRVIPPDFITALSNKYPTFALPLHKPGQTPEYKFPFVVSQVPPPPPARVTRSKSALSGQSRTQGQIPPIPPQQTPITEPAPQTTDTSDGSSSSEESGEAETSNRQVNEEVITPVNVDEPVTTNDGRKRKITWYLHEWAGEDDTINKRNPDGTLIPLTTYHGEVEEQGKILRPDSEIPTELFTPDVIEFWNEIHAVNGKVFYDPEEIALGSLTDAEFMLVPSTWEVKICPVEDIGGGLKRFRVDILTMSAVYALAKEQAKKLKMTDDNQIKWALLRLEAFKAGWFDRQKFTRFEEPPKNSMSKFCADKAKIDQWMKTAYRLCAFVPFITEFHFRSFGASYNPSNSGDFVNRAQRFAESIGISQCLTFMDADCLYSRALAWIGVRRPMLVLRSNNTVEHIPHVFRLRAYAPPAGAATITTSIAVIQSIESTGWWAHMKKIGGYDDASLLDVGEKISANPWRYHILYTAYGVEGLTDDEAADFATAKKFAEMIAPALQAYVEVVMANTPLAHAKALKKHANSNMRLFNNYSQLFKYAVKNKSRSIDQVHATEQFMITEAGEPGGSG